MNLDNAMKKIEEYLIDYNTIMPHSSILDLPPEEFIIVQKTPPNSQVNSVTNQERTR
jgi:hypothetical protein